MVKSASKTRHWGMAATKKAAVGRGDPGFTSQCFVNIDVFRFGCTAMASFPGNLPKYETLQRPC